MSTDEVEAPTPEAGTPSPAEMAERLGCAVEDVADVMLERIRQFSDAVDKLQKQWTPPKPNREQRRAMKRGTMPNNVPRVRR